MDASRAVEQRPISPPTGEPIRFATVRARLSRAARIERWSTIGETSLAPFLLVFIAYVIAGRLGQATTNIRSSNLGPVWPASGIALAAFLAYGYRVWPAIAASAFLIAYLSPVPAITAAGQAAGATIATALGTFLLRRIAHFDPKLRRLSDALGLIILGAIVSPIISATIGLFSLYATGLQAYSGLASAWLIYWLGDGTGVLLITPLVFTLPGLLTSGLMRRTEFVALAALLTTACVLIFGDLALFQVHLHVLAFAVLPFTMWAAIRFGIGGAALSVFLIATIATLLTALGHGPFAGNSPFINAVMLDVLFSVLSVSGLALAAVIAERERAEARHDALVREQAAKEARLRLTAIVESSNDAIISIDLDGVIQSWNAAAQRIFGYTEAEAIGRHHSTLIPAEAQDEERTTMEQLTAGESVQPFETIRLTREGTKVHVSAALSPLRDASGRLVGASKILRDITGQKQAEEALSRLNRRLIQAHEEERSRIARELHDDIGQRLAVLSINLTGLAKGLADSPQLQMRTMELEKHAADIAVDLQALSRDLHSSKLELLGLVNAVRSFCHEFANQQNVAVDVDAHDVPSNLPADISLCLFRILQEALHNSVKHSESQHVEVRLWSFHGVIHLTIVDHGVGFNVEASQSGRGLGLASMAERIKLVNGELSIESQPKHGTTIHARVDLTAASPIGIADAMSRPPVHSARMHN